MRSSFCRFHLQLPALTVLLYLLEWGAVPSSAQLSTTATIAGNVTDSSGALVPDATVTATDEATKIATVRKTGADGSYVIPSLAVDPYTISISKDGFNTYTVSGIILHPATTANISGILQPGSVTDKITVTAAAVQVETTTSEISTEVNSAQVSTLPMNGRNYQALATVMPGVQNTSAGNALTTGGRSTNNALSVNGLSQSRTFYALDGIWNENTGNMNQTTVIPNPDSIEEVRVLQNNYSAKYSLMGSSVVLLQTKSGSRALHGTLWEFLRNDIFNSKPYFATTVLPYKQNIFGYNLSGPIFVPKVYNVDRQKTFFFWSQQFVRLHQATGQTGTTPLPNQLNGIFNSPIKDPSTGKLFPQNAQGQWFIPTAQLNSAAVAFAKALYPAPNRSGSTNFYNTKPQITDQRDDEIKVDHHFNSKYSLLAEYLDEEQTFVQSSLSGSQSGEVFPSNWETDLTHNKLAQVSLTALLTPNLINTVSLGMNIFDLDLNLSGTYNVSQIPGFSTSLPYNGFLSERLPLVTFSGGIGAEGIAAARPLHHASDLDDTVSDDVSWNHGRHYLQAGVTVVFNTKRQNPATATNGQFTFSGTFTQPTAQQLATLPSGTAAVTQDDAFADFLLGRATTFTQASDEMRVAVHGIEVSPYFEDQFKLTKNLTVQAGVRVYYMPLPHPPPNSSRIFLPRAFDPAKAPTVKNDQTITATPNYDPLNGLVLNGTGLPVNFSNKHNWYFGPIVGFAWDVTGDGRTSIRGGFGMTYTRIFTNQDCSFSCASNPPKISTINLQNPIFPNPTGGPQTLKPATIGSLSSADEDVRATTIESYSLSIQHQFPRNWAAALVGASTQARHVVGTFNINQAPHFGQFDYNPALNASAAPTQYIYAPYPGYGAISTIGTRLDQNWNAFEASLRHPVGNLVFTASYTWSHDLGDLAGAGIDPANPARFYGSVDGLDFRHSASFTAIYAMPWLKQGNFPERFLLAGWKVSGISTLRSGTSLTPGLSIANQGLSARPDVNQSAALKGPKTQKQWFNTSAFQRPASGYFGNAGTGVLRGPALLTLDTALYKEFHVRESNFFEFRAEAFNVLNHTNFSGVNTTFGNSSFGNVTSATDPRVLELALRYKF